MQNGIFSWLLFLSLNFCKKCFYNCDDKIIWPWLREPDCLIMLFTCLTDYIWPWYLLSPNVWFYYILVKNLLLWSAFLFRLIDLTYLNLPFNYLKLAPYLHIRSFDHEQLNQLLWLILHVDHLNLPFWLDYLTLVT